MKRNITLIILLFIGLGATWAQPTLTVPQWSPKASTMQEIGLSTVSVTYSRPQVKGREVWGKLVPYGRIWRAGANENTAITLTHDATINGADLPAGTYGFHIIPTESDEWTLIFSKDHDAWGSYFYNKENDALRVSTNPTEGEHVEALSYSFTDVSSNSCKAVMAWGKKRVAFTVEFDVHAIVVASMEEELTSLAGFYPQCWQQIAAYCVSNEVYLDKAEAYVDRSIRMGKSFANLNTKAQLLRLQNKKDEAEKLMDEAMAMATEQEINTYGYQLMNAGETDKAIEVFTLNTKENPKSWNCWDSLAEAYLNTGDKSKAKKYYTKARNMAPENQHSRIDDILSTI